MKGGREGRSFREKGRGAKERHRKSKHCPVVNRNRKKPGVQAASFGRATRPDVQQRIGCNGACDQMMDERGQGMRQPDQEPRMPSTWHFRILILDDRPEGWCARQFNIFCTDFQYVPIEMKVAVGRSSGYSNICEVGYLL